MATTKIWPVKGDLGLVLRYVQNEDKTEPSRQRDSLESVLDYVGRGDKTDERQFVSGLNCAPGGGTDGDDGREAAFWKDGWPHGLPCLSVLCHWGGHARGGP